MADPFDMGEYLHAVDALAPIARAERAEMDRRRALPDTLARALVVSRLNKLWVPRELGGAELDLPAALAVYERACRIDGTLGWALTIGVGGGLFAAYLPPASAETIYAPEAVLIAGSGAPNGRLARDGDGWRVNGRWQWASGIDRATWVTASCWLDTNSDDGEPALRAVAVPVAQVTVHDTWHSVALAGTASHDVSLHDVHVPDAYTFDLTRPPRLDRPLYRYPFFQAAEASFASAALGMAWGAFDAWRAAMTTRTIDGRPASRHDGVQERATRAESGLRAADHWLHASAAQLWREVAAGRPADPASCHEVTLASVHASRAGVEAIGPLLETAGMAPLDALDPLGRFWRDLQAAARHGLTSTQREAALGAPLLE